MTRAPQGALAVFAILLGAYAWFFQGGGWNQNARFAQVRAMAERGDAHINAYLRYAVRRDSAELARLRRDPLPDPATGGEDASRFASLDLSFREGRYYPNKPPGLSWLGVPGYLVVRSVERVLGLDSDDAWPLAVAAHVTTVLSVGLLGALGGVLLLFTSRRLVPEAPEWTHEAAALTLGLATLYGSFATTFFDHVPTAVGLLGVFLAVLSSRGETGDFRLGVAGLLLGSSIAINYLALAPAAVLVAYAIAVVRPRRRLAALALGTLPPIVALLAYHWTCFGGPLVVATTFQNAAFNEEEALVLGSFRWPDPKVAVALLVSRYRGLFFSSPALLLGCWGVATMLRERRVRTEGVVVAAIAAVYLLANAAFVAWHAGWNYAPRYLIPAVPFVALGLAPAFARAPRLSLAVAIVSGAATLLPTAITPFVPQTVRDPYGAFLLPLARGDTLDIEGIMTFAGPVSANPVPIHGIRFMEAWGAFNLGEALWPHSWLSIAPIGVAVAGILLARRGRSRARD